LTAGHCGSPTSSSRIHFTYGSGNAPAEDQYTFNINNHVGVNGGVGNDWGIGRLNPNSSTGKLPGIAQQEKCGTSGHYCPEGKGWYTLGAVPGSTEGEIIRVTGYGTAATSTLTQKTHTGGFASFSSTALRYTMDTTVSVERTSHFL